MQISAFLAAVAAFLPIVYGAPTAAANSLHPDILAAMKRDLGLDAEQAHARVARELQATDVIKTLESKAGFAGAWLVDGDLKVAVTDEALTSEVNSAGAEALVVDTPLSKLQEAQKAIDALDIEGLTKRDEAAKGIAAYYVDVAANKLVLEALADSTAQAEDLAKKVGLVAGEYEPKAECFSVSNGRFSRVFKDDLIKQDSSFDAVKEARTGYAYPGLWDGHGHLIQFGELLNSVDLFGSKSMAEVQDRLVQYKTAHPDEGTRQYWIRGVGWDQAHFGGAWPGTSDLEIGEAFKDQYVMLDRVDVHCIWVSDKVLELLPSPLPEVPAGGEVVAKGVFCDNAMDVVLEYYPKPGNARKAKFVKDAMVELNKLGIVGMHDAGVVPRDLKLYEELSNDADWTIRVNAMIECDIRNSFCPSDVKKVSTPNGKFHVRSVKLFGDGALGSWGSAMIDPYSDKEASTGSLLVNATVLSALTQNWAAEGYQVNIHAIGDLANRLAIDAFEITLKLQCSDITNLKQCQQEKFRFRIEHAQIIHPDDQRRMFELGIIPSIQPTHATSDMGYAESRLGKQRTANEAYRMRSILPLGPVLGSDFPVEPASIFEGMYAATTRRSPRTGLDPSGGKTGWYPEETLTVEDALKGFTVNPAIGAFLDGQVGVIEDGAWADWVVLDSPLEGMDLEDLRRVTVRETWVGGKLVYRRSGH